MSTEETSKPKRKTRTSSAVKDRYNKKTYIQFAARIRPETAQRIEEYTTSNGISKPEFLRIAIETLEQK